MEFKIRCSAISQIIAGQYGLTDAQQRILEELEKKEKLTEKQSETLNDLRIKSKQNEFSEGAKTYSKRWLKQKLYNRYMPLDNKYVNKGLKGEEDAFTLLALVLKLGMVFKNEDRKSNDYMSGECDLYHNGVVYDNKCSWSLETFPMFEYKPDIKYYWQGQGYMELWNADLFKLCYTLIDCPFDILEKELKWIEDENDRQVKASNLIFTSEAWKFAKSKYNHRIVEDIFEEHIALFKVEEPKEDAKVVKKKATSKASLKIVSDGV